MTEADLCDQFVLVAEKCGWIVYPECGGFDLLAVWDRDMPPRPSQDYVERGDQIGIEAKLRANCDVLAQAMPGPFRRVQEPNFRAVLVPRAGKGFYAVAMRLNVFVFEMTRINGQALAPPRTYRVESQHRCTLPEIKPLFSGGEPCPRSLSAWRIAALRLCTKLRRDGYITGADFGGMSRSTWVDRWVVRDGSEGRYARYVAIPGAELPDYGYERERDALAEHDRRAGVSDRDGV